MVHLVDLGVTFQTPLNNKLKSKMSAQIECCKKFVTHVLSISEKASVVIKVIHDKAVEAVSALGRPIPMDKNREGPNICVESGLPLRGGLELHPWVAWAGKV